MLFLTWNLKRTERAFRLALDYLSGVDGGFVAAFQELPAMADSSAKAKRQALSMTKSRVRCLGVVGSVRAPGRLGLFCSPDIAATEPITTDANIRMAMTELRSKT